MSERCVRCGDVDEDWRTLWMACFYEMAELDVPFKNEPCGDRDFYTLRVCKDCRADWLDAIQEWFGKKPQRELTGTGVFVRRNGATIELTEDEIAERFPNGDFVRVRSGDE